MIIDHTLSHPILLVAALITLQANAQERTKDGIALRWDHSIDVKEEVLTNGAHSLPAHTITVYESDANTVMDMFKEELKTSSQGISGHKPVRVTGAMVPSVSDQPLLLLAQGTTERKAGSGVLTVAFALNDSTPFEGADAVKSWLRDLSVKFNKAVVQAQIDARTRMLDKAADKYSSAQADQAKLEKRMAKANSDHEKAKSRTSKLQRDKAKLQGDVHGLESKFALSNDPKDLKRLTKARQRLAKQETAIAKAMQNETKALGAVNKLRDSAPKAASTVQDRAESREEIQRIISELKRKQDNIR